MSGDVRRYVARNRAILAFLDANTAALGAAPIVTTLHATLQTQQDQITQIAQRQGTQGDDASSVVQSKSALLLELDTDLRAISRTARAIEQTKPGTEAKFTLPTSKAAEALVSAARVFLSNAATLQADFVAYGLPANFWTDLQTDLGNYETSAGTQQTATQNRIGATDELENVISASAKTVDALDAAVRNVFRGNKSKIAEWRHAKIIERGNIHRDNPPPPPINPA